MSYQVVNPATGEIAAMLGSEGPSAVLNFRLAKEMCDNLFREKGERWDVIKIEVLYTGGEHGSESRSGGADS